MDINVVKEKLGLEGNSGVVTISPETAKFILENCNTFNRKISSVYVNKYLTMMNSGDWELGTDAIGFSSDGVLVNGQHRLTALSKQSESFQFLVILNVKPSVNLDVGLKRSFQSNALFASNLDPRLKNRKNIIEVATSIYTQAIGSVGTASNHNNVLKFINKYADDLIKCDDAGLFTRPRSKGVNSPVIRAAYFVAYKCGVLISDLVSFNTMLINNDVGSAENYERCRVINTLYTKLMEFNGGGHQRKVKTFNMVLYSIYIYENNVNGKIKGTRLNSKTPKYVYDFEV